MSISLLTELCSLLLLQIKTNDVRSSRNRSIYRRVCWLVGFCDCLYYVSKAFNMEQYLVLGFGEEELLTEICNLSEWGLQ